MASELNMADCFASATKVVLDDVNANGGAVLRTRKEFGMMIKEAVPEMAECRLDQITEHLTIGLSCAGLSSVAYQGNDGKVLIIFNADIGVDQARVICSKAGMTQGVSRYLGHRMPVSV